MGDGSSTTPGEDDDVFLELLAAALQASESDQPLDLEILCADHPHLIPRISESLASAPALLQLTREASTYDPHVASLVLDRYEIQNRVGSGGMGVVYEAFDHKLQRRVALKMLRPDLVATPEAESRLNREAQMLARVEHPAIVPVFDQGRTEDGRIFLVMSLISGFSLSEVLDAAIDCDPPGPHPMSTKWLGGFLSDAPHHTEPRLESNLVRQSVTWIEQVARGLEVLHGSQVIHRDVKPSNILIQADGKAVLIDFGLVSLAGEATLSNSDSALGTPAYMAPEQLDRRIKPRPATDVYGLCATLYQLLTFQRPFEGTPSQILTAVAKKDPIPAGKIRPGLPSDLLAILDKGMIKEVGRRYPSAKQLADDLRAWLDFEPVSARPISALRRTSRKAWRSPVVKTLLALAVGVLVALSFSFWLDGRERERKARIQDLEAQVTAHTLISPASLKPITEPAADAAQEGILRELTRLQSDAIPARVLYAGFLRARGRYEEARAEFEIAATARPSKLMSRLLDEYRKIQQHNFLEPEHLPTVQSDSDRFVAAYHLLWKDSGPRLQAAEKLMRECSTDRVFLGELRVFLSAMLSKIESPQGDPSALNPLLLDLTEIRENRGFSTALLRKAECMCLFGLHRPHEAMKAAEAGLAHAPSDFTLWQNLGRCQLEVARPREAIRSFKRMIALQPKTRSGYFSVFLAHLYLREFREARAWVDDTLSHQSFTPAALSDLRGTILLHEAFNRLQEAREPSQSIATAPSESAADIAERALQTFSSTRPSGSRPTYKMALCQAISAPQDMSAGLIRVVSGDALNWRKIRELALLLPDRINREQAKAIRELLFSISLSLAPEQIFSGQ